MRTRRWGLGLVFLAVLALLGAWLLRRPHAPDTPQVTRPTLEVTPHRPHTLTGRVLSGGAPVPGAEVRVERGEDIPSSGAQAVTTDAEGRFRFVLPFGGPHTLSASHDGRYAVARVELGASPPPEVILEPGSALHVEGRVSDDARRPVAGARVSIWSSSTSVTTLETVTRADGRYQLGPVEPGIWRFRLEAERYVDTRESLERTLAAGMGPVDFTLARASSVTGRVTDPEGKPLPGLELSLVRPESDDPPYFPELQEKAWTDEDGRFVLDADAPGKYHLEVRDERFLDIALPVRAPSKDLRLTMRPGASVAGTVVDASGVPLEQFRVRLGATKPEDTPGAYREAHTDEQGRFRLRGVKPGHYVLTASRDMDGVTRKASREVELKDGVQSEVELRLDAGRTLSGLVVDGAGRPLEGVYLRAHLPERGVLRIKERNRGRPGPPSGSTPSGPDGRFTLRHLTEAAYEVSAWKDGYTLVPERSTGAPLVEEHRFAVGPDTGPLHLVLERQPHFVGRVVGPDGAPIPSFTVHNLPVEESSDGAFALPMQADGSLFLIVMAEGLAPLTLMVEQHLAGPDVDLGVLRMTEGRTVRGRVIDARTSAPVKHAFIELATGHTRPTGLDYTVTNHLSASDGTFALHHVDTRTGILIVSANGYPLEQRVRLDSAPEELTVRMDSGPRGGAPVPPR
ncbi:carboxypeptidase regulatory-like domain-containing protein [Pyxidicoccus sp. 3LG]